MLKPEKIDVPCNSQKQRTRCYVKPGNFNKKGSTAAPRRRERRHWVRTLKVVWKKKRKPALLMKKPDDVKRKGEISERWRRDWQLSGLPHDAASASARLVWRQKNLRYAEEKHAMIASDFFSTLLLRTCLVSGTIVHHV